MLDVRCLITGGPGDKIPVLFVESTLQYQLLKVDVRHSSGDRLQVTVLPEDPHLPFKTDAETEKKY